MWRDSRICRTLQNGIHSQSLQNSAERHQRWNARRKVGRFRFCTRGEAFATLQDVERVADVVASNPLTLFWIPTRGWRNALIRDAIELQVLPLPNARVLASIDPSNDNGEVNAIIERGWSTMFYGNDEVTSGRFKCSKTHEKVKGACRTCEGGCFDAKFGHNQVHVHLKQH